MSINSVFDNFNWKKRNSLFQNVIPYTGRHCSFVHAESVAGTTIFYPVFSKELIVQERVQKRLQKYLDNQLCDYLDNGGVIPLDIFNKLAQREKGSI